MTSVPIFEAKTRLSELLTRAQQGEVITITRHGTPAGRLVAPEAPAAGATAELQAAQTEQVDQVFQALGALRQGVSLDLPLRDAITQGRD